MTMPIRLLMINDSEDDAMSAVNELKRSGYAPEFERVDTASAMRAALGEKPWDIVVSEVRLDGSHFRFSSSRHALATGFRSLQALMATAHPCRMQRNGAGSTLRRKSSGESRFQGLQSSTREGKP